MIWTQRISHLSKLPYIQKFVYEISFKKEFLWFSGDML